MAEVGIVASIIQIADTGLRLSLKLYTFGEIVSTADKSIISISKDVSLTSSVLKELGQILDQDRHAKICSQNAVRTADDLVRECLGVFEEMEGLLAKKLPNLGIGVGEKAKRATVLLERLKWPYLQPKLELMRTNLERLKSTLNLMLNVIALARQQISKKEPPEVIASQKTLIEDLVRSNDDYIRRFEQMKLSIDYNTNTQFGEHDCSALSLYPDSFQSPSRDKEIYMQAPQKPSQPLSGPSMEGGLGQHSYDFLRLALVHFQTLMGSLLREVHAPTCRIPAESRSRIGETIVRTHMREISETEARLRSLQQSEQQWNMLQQQNMTHQAMNSLDSFPNPNPPLGSEARIKRAASKSRKRTKTGCLTCRKRRIPCDGGYPTCSNCVQSKRECEGYTPRVAFEDPLGTYQQAHEIPSQGRTDDPRQGMQAYPVQQQACGMQQQRLAAQQQQQNGGIPVQPMNHPQLVGMQANPAMNQVPLPAHMQCSQVSHTPQQPQPTRTQQQAMVQAAQQQVHQQAQIQQRRNVIPHSYESAMDRVPYSGGSSTQEDSNPLGGPEPARVAKGQMHLQQARQPPYIGQASETSMYPEISRPEEIKGTKRLGSPITGTDSLATVPSTEYPSVRVRAPRCGFLSARQRVEVMARGNALAGTSSPRFTKVDSESVSNSHDFSPLWLSSRSSDKTNHPNAVDNPTAAVRLDSGSVGTSMESRCWDHGCNGRRFSSFSDLLRHQQEMMGTRPELACDRCGAEFQIHTAAPHRCRPVVEMLEENAAKSEVLEGGWTPGEISEQHRHTEAKPGAIGDPYISRSEAGGLGNRIDAETIQQLQSIPFQSMSSATGDKLQSLANESLPTPQWSRPANALTSKPRPHLFGSIVSSARFSSVGKEHKVPTAEGADKPSERPQAVPMSQDGAFQDPGTQNKTNVVDNLLALWTISAIGEGRK